MGPADQAGAGGRPDLFGADGVRVVPQRTSNAYHFNDPGEAGTASNLNKKSDADPKSEKPIGIPNQEFSSFRSGDILPLIRRFPGREAALESWKAGKQSSALARREEIRMTTEHALLALAVIAALLMLGIAVWLWWWLPKRAVTRLALNSPRDRADVEDNFRKTVGQALGGAAVLIGAFIAYLQFSQQQQSSHDLLISTQVSKGFEQLGNKDVIDMRLGGIYALEGVMNNSDQYHQPVLEALTAFVREHTTASALPMPRPLPDIQAALTVIGRCSAGEGGINLNQANITGADLRAANLSGARLGGAHLSNANLRGARLSDAILFDSDLTGALLIDANLTNANLEYADLTNAKLVGAKLSGIDLRAANLTNANLTDANMTGARLDGQQQLDGACGASVVLPTGLTLKPCPSQGSPSNRSLPSP
jgi:uncharacterized protein YjbI with pentapeptide repeats